MDRRQREVALADRRESDVLLHVDVRRAQQHDDGAAQPLAVTLTVTDSSGGTATVTSGSGSQPPLFLRLFKC